MLSKPPRKNPQALVERAKLRQIPARIEMRATTGAPHFIVRSRLAPRWKATYRELSTLYFPG